MKRRLSRMGDREAASKTIVEIRHDFDLFATNSN